jgi:hypothetical protein
MEQITVEQILELLAKMNANQARMIAKLDARLGEVKACEGTTKAFLEEKKEPTPEETGAVEEPQEVPEGVVEVEEEPTPEETEVMTESREVPKGGTDEETRAGTEDRTGEQRLAVRRHRQQKKRAQVNGGPLQKFAAARGRFTRHAVPAMRKGHVRRGLGMKYRRSGIKGLGKTSGNRMEGRSLKQRRPEYNVVPGTAKGKTCEERRRTRLECNDGIRGRGARQHRRLERKKTHSEAIGQKLDVKIAKFIFESYIRLREPGDWLLWKCRPPPKRKR